MKTIVTGGAGFIGSNLVDKLILDGHDVLVIDNESSTANETFYYNNNATYIWYDVSEYDKIKHLFEGVDTVFHLAAEARIQPALKNPTRAVKSNMLGTCSVLQAARDCGIKRVVYSSTSSIYGLINEPPLYENMPNDCLNPYSVSKCGGEELCKMYWSLFGLETIILRYFNVYGERQPTQGQYAPVVGLFQKQFSQGKPMTVVGDGLQTRDYTHVYDVVEANVLAFQCDNQEAFGKVFNVGTGQSYSIMDLVKLIDGEDANFEYLPERPGEARDTLANCDKAKEILNWQAKIKLEDWINEQA